VRHVGHLPRIITWCRSTKCKISYTRMKCAMRCVYRSNLMMNTIDGGQLWRVGRLTPTPLTFNHELTLWYYCVYGRLRMPKTFMADILLWAGSRAARKKKQVITNRLRVCVTFIVSTSLLTNVAAGWRPVLWAIYSRRTSQRLVSCF
jgi:hypothetical protein